MDSGRFTRQFLSDTRCSTAERPIVSREAGETSKNKLSKALALTRVAGGCESHLSLQGCGSVMNHTDRSQTSEKLLQASRKRAQRDQPPLLSSAETSLNPPPSSSSCDHHPNPRSYPPYQLQNHRERGCRLQRWRNRQDRRWASPSDLPSCGRGRTSFLHRHPYSSSPL